MSNTHEPPSTSERFWVPHLKQQWQLLLQELSPTADTDPVNTVFDSLVTRYSEPTRAYHTLEHISEMLTLIDTHQKKLATPSIVRAATWFHDAVYDSKAGDNEEQSAQLARSILEELGVAPDTIDSVAGYILATKTHDLPPNTDPNSDLAFFLDIDMSILGSNSQRYAEYVRGISFEYNWARNVDGKDVYRPRRLHFLQEMLGKPIFHTNVMKHLESQARVNIQAEIDMLQPS